MSLQYYTEENGNNNDVYEVIKTPIPISKDDFHEIKNPGSKPPSYFPRKELVTKIGMASGIEFTSECRTETIYGDKINGVEKRIGLRVFKQAKKKRIDGTWQVFSPQSYEYNWEDQSEIAILKDMDNIGKKWNDGNPKAKYNFPDNPQKEQIARLRKAAELKHKAYEKADTGAMLRCIRAIIGLPTAFTGDQLKLGEMQFSQVVESREYQKLKATAVIENIRSGGAIAGSVKEAAGLLGAPIQHQEEATQGTPDLEEPKNVDDAPIVISDREYYDLLTSKKEFKDWANAEKVVEFVESKHFDAGSITWAINGIIKGVFDGKSPIK